MSYPLSRKNAEIILITLGYTARAGGEALDRAYRTGSASVRYHRITWDLTGYRVRSVLGGEASAALRLVLAVAGLSYAEAITAVRDPGNQAGLDEAAALGTLASHHGYSPSLARWAVQAAITAPDHVIFLDRHRVHCDEGAYDIYQRDDAADTRILAAREAVRPPEAAKPDDWPDLSLGYDVTEILAALRVVDDWLDGSAPAIYRQDPAASGELNEARALANMWRRIAAGPASEGIEAVDALNGMTGGNPRKGVTHTRDDVMGELADGAVANLLAVQSFTKDTAATWTVFLAALAKALSRVPRERADGEVTARGNESC